MNAYQRRKQARAANRCDKKVIQLLEKYPDHENTIRFFLNTPNSFIDGKLPVNQPILKIESLLEQYMHPADVF
jgi:hypothetical protein